MNSVLISALPSLISLHEEYVKSGADLITTFTFRTNPTCCEEESKSSELVRIAVSAARKAAKIRQGVSVLGSNGPA